MKQTTFIDAYGRELTDVHKGTAQYEVIERDDGYLDAAPATVYLDGYAQWAPTERAAMRFARGRVLDIGCGAGRHALHLQGKGLDVTGIDNSPLAIKLCKSRGLRKALVRPIAEIGRFAPAAFGTVLMLGNNFGLFGSFRNARRLLRELHRITSPAARIIAQTLDPQATTNPDHLAYHRRNRQHGRMPGQVRIRVRYHGIIGPWFDYLFVSKPELARILDGTGWAVRTYLDSQGPQYIMVLEKTP